MEIQANFAGGDNLIDHRDHRRMRAFVRAVKTDLQNAESLFHSRALRNVSGEHVGVEQELQFVDRAGEPTWIADQVASMLQGPGFQKEFSQFTFEIALNPVRFEGKVLDNLHDALASKLREFHRRVMRWT
jgi:hypothetical protein